ALLPVADEPASPMRDVSQGEACPTDPVFVADQDRGNIAKTSTLPHEPTSRVTSFAADEGSLQLQLKARVKFLEDRQGEGINLSGDDAPIKGRRLDKEEVATKRVSNDTEEIRLDEGEVAAERVSNDTEEMATVLIIMDAASVLSSGGVQGKEKMVETHTPKKKKRLQEHIDIQFAKELEEELEREAQRMNAQIARDEEIAKIHAEEELQQMIEGLDRNNLGWKVKDFKGMSFEEVETKFKTVWEQIEGGVSKIFEREAAWLKKKGIRSEQESAKKQKTSLTTRI
nr:synaptobrevin, longin-like domain protein [Tanacetum cinerariifolium]